MHTFVIVYIKNCVAVTWKQFEEILFLFDFKDLNMKKVQRAEVEQNPAAHNFPPPPAEGRVSCKSVVPLALLF